MAAEVVASYTQERGAVLKQKIMEAEEKILKLKSKQQEQAASNKHIV